MNVERPFYPEKRDGQSASGMSRAAFDEVMDTLDLRGGRSSSSPFDYSRDTQAVTKEDALHLIEEITAHPRAILALIATLRGKPTHEALQYAVEQAPVIRPTREDKEKLKDTLISNAVRHLDGGDEDQAIDLVNKVIRHYDIETFPEFGKKVSNYVNGLLDNNSAYLAKAARIANEYLGDSEKLALKPKAIRVMGLSYIQSSMLDDSRLKTLTDIMGAFKITYVDMPEQIEAGLKRAIQGERAIADVLKILSQLRVPPEKLKEEVLSNMKEWVKAEKSDLVADYASGFGITRKELRDMLESVVFY